MKVLKIKLHLADPDAKQNPADPVHGTIECKDPAGNKFEAALDHDGDLSAATHLVKTLTENLAGILDGYDGTVPKPEKKTK